ncbi:enoyl-CoA hydratase/isomerase family protein [Sphingobium sp.]|uniref:enoyl-CoA hydratase/isomerase family protein n=1 Tax=Sphingobium sp. TaxID=1912891 RepID=UPI0028BEC40C|nr:enoyl-CoA hydratase/isomerase family protein [Sphingobium sp.]
MVAMKETDAITVSAGDASPGIRLLCLNRPESRNAMSPAMVEQMIAWLEMAAHDPSISAIVIHGAGKGFCAGSDLAGLAAMDAAARSAFEAASGRLARLLTAFPRPVIAAVHGFAIGGGLTLAAACDIVVTTADARWSLPEVPIGLFPAWGLEAVSQRMGRARARRLSWGIDRLDGHGAVAIGLADELADQLLPAALAMAQRLVELPLAQSAAVKQYFVVPRDAEAGDRQANALFLAACGSEAAKASFVKFGSDRSDGGNSN